MGQNRYAFLIGANGPQTERLSSLRYAERDAERLSDALSNNPCAFTKVTHTIASNAHTTLSELEAFTKQCSPSDLLVMHFSGHAYHFRGHLYLLCNDTDTGRLVSSALDIQFIKDILQDCRASHKLLILDCCHAGAALPDGLKGNQEITTALQEALQGSGSAILAACSSIKQARELEMLDGGAGFLSWAFASACTTHFKDVSLDNVSLSLTEVWQRGIIPMHKEINQKLSKDEQLPPPHFWNRQEGDGEIWLTETKRDNTQKDHHNKQAHDREHFLEALLADHTSFMHGRLDSFVGREKELAEIRQRIDEKQQTGGYVTITGQAGQGKSSIIAKLVEQYEPEKVAFHFIPFNPGPDHQVGLLRNIMARLILKYNLSDLYVASESRPALRDYFPKVLAELASQGGKEVIFIDGLDQLETEYSGERDLSFLPNNPPSGVVFVLGTRPNDTLRPLELLKSRHEYQLPDLSREDFNLILQHRQVYLDRTIVDRLYKAMQQNALFLDLLAKELVELGVAPPEELINRLAHNPEHLFSLAMARFKRQPMEWREVIKPVLGVLLVTREPIGLRHIRQIINDEHIDDDRLRDGIERLGGLITRDWQQRYSLFHLKFYEYLRENEQKPAKEYIFAKVDEESWHKKLALWCEQRDLPTIWLDVEHNLTEQHRREYGRKHYITHLYLAHEWEELFKVLDMKQYGWAKVRFDPSTRSYAQDLDLGRQAASWEGWTLKEAIELLPRLWQYTLLRCSLTSRADQYPFEAFQLLMLLKRKQESLGLAELLTEPMNKARVLLQLAELTREAAAPELEWIELFARTSEVAQTIENSEARFTVLSELGTALLKAQQWEQADRVIHLLEESHTQANALSKLGAALARAGKWKQAERAWKEVEGIIRTMKTSEARSEALYELGTQLAEVRQWEPAERVIRSIERKDVQTKALSNLCLKLSQAQQWQQAEKFVSSIEDNDARTRVLGELGIQLAQAGQWQRAQKVIYSIKWGEVRAKALAELGLQLTQAGQWQQAEEVIRSIANNDVRAKALPELGLRLAQAGQQEQAERVWADAEEIIYFLKGSDAQTKALQRLGTALAQAGQWQQAEEVIRSIENNDVRAQTLTELGLRLAQADQQEQAERVWIDAQETILLIGESEVRSKALAELGLRLAQAGQQEQAERVWTETEHVIHSLKGSDAQTTALQRLGTALVQAGQWQQAEDVIRSIENNDVRARVLQGLGTALAQAGQWQQAEDVIRSIENSDAQTKALQGLGTALAQAGQWQQAEEIIRSIENNDAQTTVLQGLGTALTQAGQWQQAEEVIRSIENSDAQTTVLQGLGTALAQAGQWQQAERVIRSIENNNVRARALQELGTALAQTGQWQQAEEIIRSIKSSDVRAKALAELGLRLAQADQQEQAERVWTDAKHVIHYLKGSDAQTKALQELGTALAQAGQWQQAEEIIRSIKSSDVRAKALAELGLRLAQAGQQEQAERVWTDAKQMIPGYPEDNECRMLHQWGTALVQAHQWEWAEKVSLSIIDSPFYSEAEGRCIRAEAIADLGLQLAQAGQWQQAERVIRSIKRSGVQIRALCDLGAILARRQQEKRAVRVWTALEKRIHLKMRNEAQAEALGELGLSFADAKQWDKAEKVWAEAERLIQSIEDIYARSKALGELGMKLAKGHQGEWAERVILSIDWRVVQTRALAELSMRLIRAQQWESSERVIQLLEDFNVRDKELGELVEKMTNAGEFERLLHLIQSSWWHALTRDDTLRLYPLVTGFIPRNPELGSALHEAFTWTDNFLKG